MSARTSRMTSVRCVASSGASVPAAPHSRPPTVGSTNGSVNPGQNSKSSTSAKIRSPRLSSGRGAPASASSSSSASSTLVAAVRCAVEQRASSSVSLSATPTPTPTDSALRQCSALASSLSLWPVASSSPPPLSSSPSTASCGPGSGSCSFLALAVVLICAARITREGAPQMCSCTARAAVVAESSFSTSASAVLARSPTASVGGAAGHPTTKGRARVRIRKAPSRLATSCGATAAPRCSMPSSGSMSSSSRSTAREITPARFHGRVTRISRRAASLSARRASAGVRGLRSREPISAAQDSSLRSSASPSVSPWTATQRADGELPISGH
mmetsp:Transcript_5488/g.13701  ORF Transcript_5488/g.13701 Transcript_5488/m.13701 type:complete len:329 (-) Transcript_5488:67-1053(-)